MSASAIYGIGVVVVVAGLFYVENLSHVPTQWIVAMVILVVGAGLVGMANSTKKPS